MHFQVADTGEVHETEVKDFVEDSLDMEANQLSAKNTDIENSKQGNGLIDVFPPNVAYPEKKSRKRGRKATGKAQKEQIEKDGDLNNGTNVDLEGLSKVNQQQTWDNRHNSSTLVKTNKRGKKVYFSTSSEPAPCTAPVLPNIPGILSNGEAKRVAESPASPCKQEHDLNLKYSRKSQRKRSRKEAVDNVQTVVEGSTPKQNQNESSDCTLFNPSLQMDINGKSSNSRQSERSFARKSKSCNSESTSSKKLKHSSDCFSLHTHVEETQPTEKINCNPDLGGLNDSSREEQHSLKTEVALRKCQNHIKKIQCCFCLSSEESEVRNLFACSP